MKRVFLHIFLPLFALLLMFGCRSKEKKFIHRMEGVWNIAQEDIIRINPDGSVEQVSSGTDIGTLTLREGDGIDQSANFLYYTIELASSNYSWRDLPFKSEEEQKRVFFYYFYCQDLFHCDMIATIEEDQANRQKWSFFRREGSGNGGTVHRKTTWVLERL